MSKYRNYSHIPENTERAVFNLGYRLGIKFVQGGLSVKTYWELCTSFASGAVQGILSMYGWQYKKASRALKIGGTPIKSYEYAQGLPKKPTI